MTTDLREYLAFAHRLADAAAAAIMPHFRTPLDIENKAADNAGYSPVTVADRAAETAMLALIEGAYPEHGVLGEEHGRRNPDAALTWVLDPIDGTKAFLAGLPMWGTLIALNEAGRPVLGIIDQPFTRERFVGGPDGAFLGETRIETRPCGAPGRATLMMTEPEMLVNEAERAAFARIASQVKMRRFGGDCYAYAMLAHGMIDIIVEGSLAPWDIQGPQAVVEAAGGVVTSWDGGPAADGGLVLACGDARLHAWALEILAPAAPAVGDAR